MTYDVNHRLLSIVEPNGQATNRIRLENVYDIQGRVTRQYDAKRNYWDFAYGTSPLQTVVTDRRGFDTAYPFDTSWRVRAVNGPEGNNVVFDYYPNNDRWKVTDGRNKTTEFTYDTRGNVTGITDPALHTTVMTYTARNDLATVVVPVKAGVSRTTTYTLSPSQKTLTITDPGNGTATGTTELLYEANGDLTKVTDGNGNWITYGPFPTSATSFNQVIADKLGNEWLSSYDKGGRLSVVVSPVGNPDDPDIVSPYSTISHLTYSAAGQLVKESVQLTSNVFLDTIYTYDLNGNLKTVKDPNGNTTTYHYDENDNRVRSVDPRGKTTTYEYDEGDNLLRVIDPTGRRTTWTYDDASRMVAITDNAGYITSYELDGAGNVTATTDPRGYTTDYEYDTIGRLWKVTDPLDHVTELGYNWAHQLVSVKDANQRTTEFTYDPAGRPQERIDPNGSIWRVDYDLGGRVDKLTDPNMKVTDYTFDDANRLDLVSYFHGTGNAYAVDYDYDGAGRRQSMSDPTGTTLYFYDNASRLKKVTAPGTGAVAYNYDNGSRLTQVVAPGNHTVTYDYDSSDRLTQVTDWLNQVTTYNYDDAGRLLGVARPNGTATTYDYDLSGWLDSIFHTAGNTTLASFAYTRDGLGNVTRLQETGGVGPAEAGYGYDPVGNRISVTANGVTTHAAYDNANRLCWDGGLTAGTCGMPTAGAATYTHDANGNRKTRTAGGATTTYNYDGADRLTSIATGGGTIATYKYDGDGYRVGKTVGGTTTAYRWDRQGAGGLGAVIGDGSGEYVYGPAGLHARIGGGATQWSHGDGLGSVRLVTNGAGAAIGGGGYEPWGSAQSGTTGLGPFAYAGEQGDSESGLVHLRARTYDPATGRFLQADPAGMAGSGVNLYPYAANNPATNVDPSGQIAWGAVAVGVVALAVLATGLAITANNAHGQAATTADVGDLWDGLLASPGVQGLDRRWQQLDNRSPIVELAAHTLLVSARYLGDTFVGTDGMAGYGGDVFASSGGMAGYTGDSGQVLNSEWGDNFFREYPQLFEKVVIHHAVPQHVLNKYPGRFTKTEMHDVSNLRGIRKEERVFHGQLAREWNKFYRFYPHATREQIEWWAEKMDDRYGHRFVPPVR